MMRERATITVGVTAELAATPTVIVVVLRPIHTALIEWRVTTGIAYKLNGAVNVT